MFETTLAGSLPKPSWLATPNVLWAPWTLTGAPLQEAKEDATALAIKRQEEAGIDIVSDGEQARQHFVHGFLAEVDGVDFDKKVRMGIRNNRYDADCPTVTAPLRRRKFVHEKEARVARAATARKLKFTLPGPMTLIDTLADGYYGDRVKMAFAFAELLNQEAKDLEKLGIDVASDRIETPEEVAATLKLATRFVDPERIQACTNCGMAPMTLATAYGKLRALAEGAALARKSL